MAVEDLGAPSDSELCQAARSPFIGLQEVSLNRPALLFSSRLSEMDAQLAALQGIADSLETDFSNTKMVCLFSFKLKKIVEILSLKVKPLHSQDWEELKFC